MTGNYAEGSIITKVGEHEFEMERIFDAPKQLVYTVFTQPAHISQWWAPFGYTIPVCKIDLRPDGLWHYCMKSPEGDSHWVASVYREIVENERIVYTCSFADENANLLDVIPKHMATVNFTEIEGKTKLIIRIQLESADDLKSTLEMGMAEGLTVTLINLESYLKELHD
jgi:uncharacterized protein YndB with AHSA1/START domain